MRHDTEGTVSPEHVRELVEQMLQTGLVLIDLFGRLLEDMPEGAFPGEDPGEVLIEMLTGSLAPVASAAGPRSVRQTAALLGAVRDRVIADLERALDLASENLPPPK